MKKVGLLVVSALLALAFSGQATTFAQGTTNQTTIQLNEQNGSGESGTATLSEQNGMLTVTVNLANAPANPQPAHIHQGTCANLNPTPLIPLNSLVNGQSTTNIDLTTNANIKTLSDLTSGQYAINVHKSAAEVTVYVACGDIVATQTGGTTTGGTTTGGTTTGGTTVPGMPTTGNPADSLPLIVMVLAGLALVTAGLKLRFSGRKL